MSVINKNSLSPPSEDRGIPGNKKLLLAGQRGRQILRRRKLAAGGVFLFIAAILFWRALPAPLFSEPYSSVITDRDGELLTAAIAADGQWRFPPGAAAPDKFVQALLRFEDRRFYYHPGVDPIAILRALKANRRAGKVVSGASTISMQVIRLARRHQPRTIKEKCIEMALALRLECSYSKKEILNLFAAHAPFGGNVVGLEAASFRYFTRPPDRLSWAETATLAVLPNSPGLIHPGRDRERLKAKRDALLNRLHQEGAFDQLTLTLAKKEELPAAPQPLPQIAMHLLSRTQANRSSDKARIRTTINKYLQTRVGEIIRRHHRELAGNEINNAAALTLEVETGAVLAYVGNVPGLEEENQGGYVDIITAPRSTGSILKPLLYAGMLNDGELLPQELVPDVPTQMGGFTPENYSRTYQGATPANLALAQSLNVPAVYMLKDYRVDRFYTLLKKLGLSTLNRSADNYGLSLILGGAEGTLWDLVGIYAGLARKLNSVGRHQTTTASFFPPHYLWGQSALKSQATALQNRGLLSLKRFPPCPHSFLIPVKVGYPKNYNWVSRPNHDELCELGLGGGKPVVPHGTPSVRHEEDPLSAAAAWFTLEAMAEVVRPEEEGEWRNFSSSRKIAWKTGTSFGFRDGWAIGITPRYAVGVWVGNADGEGRAGLTGIAAAAPILFEIFALLDDREWFARPDAELEEVAVCVPSGYRAGPDCPAVKESLIPRAGLKTPSCPYCRMIYCNADCSYQVHSDCERVADIRPTRWFVLPPTMEWYYKRKSSDYSPLPPFREDCLASRESSRITSLSLIYPPSDSRIYVPIELDGRQGRSVFKAAHRNPHAKIYWHLDDEYLGVTRELHQLALAPPPGEHTLTLVDENGEMIKRRFKVLSKGNMP